MASPTAEWAVSVRLYQTRSGLSLRAGWAFSVRLYQIRSGLSLRAYWAFSVRLYQTCYDLSLSQLAGRYLYGHTKTIVTSLSLSLMVD